MQVVMNKCFLLNPEKTFGADSSCRFREKCKKHTLFFGKMTSPSRRLGYFNNQSNCYQIESQFQASENHGLRKPETDFQSVNNLTCY